MGPMDFVTGLGKLPDPAGELERAIKFRVGLDQARQQQQMGQLEIEEAQRKAEEREAFKRDMQGYLSNPTAQTYSQMIGRHPGFQKELGDTWKALQGARQTSDFTAMGELAVLMKGGNYARAAEKLEARIAADKAAGQHDPDDEYLLASLKSGDPARQKQALGLVVMGIGAADPQHAKSFLESMGLSQEPNIMEKDGLFIDKNTMRVVGQSPYPQIISGPDGSFYKNTPGPGAISGVPVLGGGASAISAEGGGQASGGGASGFAAIDGGFVAPQEGGYAASDGASGAPVNFGINQRANPDVDVRSLTPARAQQIRHDRYWVPSGAANLSGPLQAIHYDTAINMGVDAAKDILAKSGGDPSTYMNIREARHRKMDGPQKVWAQRNAELRRFAGLGGQPAMARSKQEYDRLPSGTQYIAPDGSVRIKS